MGSRDPRIDAYIAKSKEFAQPILTYLRDTIHAAVPDVEETMKWSMPYFEYKGQLCSMAAFKEHCAFGFWKASLLSADLPKSKEAMGQMGRITTTKDLPPKRELVALIREAAKINEAGTKVVKKPAKKPPVETPPDLKSALAKNKKARTVFEGFAPSHRREYIEWITEAKTHATRQKRLAQSVEWIAEGKQRNWQHAKK
ncbi:MAG: YdeI/OmpD-associated family protein [Thermoanaerobaculia bacterium]